MTPETAEWLDDTADPRPWLAKLKSEMKEHKFSQVELARRCGCSASNISALLNWEARWTTPYVPKYLWLEYKRLPWVLK